MGITARWGTCSKHLVAELLKETALASSSLPCRQTAVLGCLHSSSSPSHLILEEFGLVLATRQSLNKAKNLEQTE